MMVPYDYGWKQLNTAVRALAGTGSIKDRLCGALLCFVHIEPERDLPDSLREDFKVFLADMTSQRAAGDEGDIQATVETFGDLELSNAADKIVWFYGEVCRQQGASKAQ